MSNYEYVLNAQGLTKTYESGPLSVTVWSDIKLSVAAGESVAIVGESGSGKTSLLNALGGLDYLDAGQVTVAGQSLGNMSEAERTKIRNRDIGFVYQFHHLLPEFSALENVMMPLLLAGVDKVQAASKAKDCLSSLGLIERVSHKPAQLSGGERQRTAIARALVHQPKLVLMDEPTGNLDHENANQVKKLIDELRESMDTAFILVTHDQQLASRMGKVYQLKDKKLVETDVI